MSTHLTGTIREKTRLTGSLGVATITTFGDATALASDITAGETAYIATGKVTGTSTLNADTSSATATASDILTGKTAYISDGTEATGTYEPLDTSDATATDADILSGETAYANGAKLTGTYIPLDTSSGDAVPADIALGKIAWVDGAEVVGSSTKNADTTDATLVANDMLYGVTGYGAAGTKLTGTGAWWQHVTKLAGTFQSNTTLPETVSIIAPNCVAMNYAFYDCDVIKNVSVQFSNNVSTMLYAFAGCNNLESITLDGSTANATTFNNAFRAAEKLATITGAINGTSCTDFTNAFFICSALVTVSFVPSTVKVNISFDSSLLLSTTSLLSIANGLNAAAAPKTLTMHATSKTNMDNISVDNVDGVAVLGSAMTLTAFVTGVKGWTIA